MEPGKHSRPNIDQRVEKNLLPGVGNVMVRKVGFKYCARSKDNVVKARQR